MQLSTIDSGRVEVSDAVFADTYRDGVVHQVVNAYIARSHTGTHANKTRAQVRGGGRKPWRQKGTGRARRGSLRSPLSRGGGVTFAAQPGKTQQKVNRRMYRSAMRSLLSRLVQDKRLLVVKDFSVEPKTKAALSALSQYGLAGHTERVTVLIVVAEYDKHLDLATRNLPHVDTCVASRLDPLSLVHYHKVLLGMSALKHLEERLS